MMTRRLLTSVLPTLAVLLLVVGCQQQTPGPPPAEPPLPGSLKTVIIPIPSDPPGFNAYLSDTGYEEVLGELVYEGLAEMAPDGSFYAKLARELPTRENGGISADGLTVTWKLRDHIVWSDGKPFTSDDVLFTYEALHHPNNKLARSTGVDLIDSMETPDDDYTVILNYREPYANIWGQFSGRGMGIFPRHACGDPGWMAGWDCNAEPMGTGPFVLQSWEEDKELVLARNPLYWQTERPFLDRLIFPIVPDDAERADLLGDGDAHASLWLTDDQIEYLQEIEGLRWASLPTRWLLRVVFNLSQPPDEDETGTPQSITPHFALADPLVRQALDTAINRQQLVEEVLGDRARVASSEFYHGFATCPDIAETPYDPETARALLTQAGWLDLDGNGVLESHGVPNIPDDTEFGITLLSVEGWDSLAKAQKLIAQMWKEVGVKVQYDLTGARDLRGGWQEGGLEVHGQFDADLWDDGYPGVDPTDYLIWRYASWSVPSMEDGGRGGNVMRFAHPEVDNLLGHALTQVDPQDRRVTFCRIASILAEQRPMLYLVYFTETHAFSPRLQGMVINPNDALTWDAFNWQID